MPTITNQGVLKAVATGFLTNNLDMGAGLRAAGYKDSYSKSAKGLRLYDRPDLIAEIQAQRVELAKKTGFTKENAHVQLDEDRTFARQMKQAAAAVSSTNAKMRLYGMDQIAPSDATVIIINPPNSVKSVESEVVDAD